MDGSTIQGKDWSGSAILKRMDAANKAYSEKPMSPELKAAVSKTTKSKTSFNPRAISGVDSIPMILAMLKNRMEKTEGSRTQAETYQIQTNLQKVEQTYESLSRPWMGMV